MHYYQFHIADWALHTSHLSVEEDGVYHRLLNHYYDTESPIPAETHLVIRRLRLTNHEKTVSNILKEFFVLKEDGWHNLRADSEIEAYNSKAETARSNGKKGGRPKKNKDLKNIKPTETQPVVDRNPEKTGLKANHKPLTKNQKPLTKNQKPETNLKPLSGKPDESAEIINYLNNQTGKSFKPVTSNTKLIKARIAEGHNTADIKTVIDNKVREWSNDKKMSKYLRPATLFNAEKFNQYVGEVGVETIEDKNQREINDWISGKERGNIIEGECS
jgi:uncharacterized phage protein (TIGR02220 family)